MATRTYRVWMLYSPVNINISKADTHFSQLFTVQIKYILKSLEPFRWIQWTLD